MAPSENRDTPNPGVARRCMLIGTLGISGVSLVVFGTVAFAERQMYQTLGVTESYVAWAILYMIGGGAALTPLVNPPRSRPAFVAIFACGFLLYSAAYMGAYFTMKSVPGEVIGIGVGSVILAVALTSFFAHWRAFPKMAAVVVVTNLLSYFAGRYIWTAAPAPFGMLGWGVIYGAGLGLGLGLAIHYAQAEDAPPNSWPQS